MQTSANPRRQSKCVDPYTMPGIPFLQYHIHPHTWPTPPPFLTPFLDCTYPPPSISPLSAEDDDAKLDSYKAISEDTYQSGVELNEYNSSRMVIFSCGTANAHGWYVQWVE